MGAHVRYSLQSPTTHPRPLFRIVVLYVEQTESVSRQLKRGKQAQAHNEKVCILFRGKVFCDMYAWYCLGRGRYGLSR
jgi:hypothetical protein